MDALLKPSMYSEQPMVDALGVMSKFSHVGKHLRVGTNQQNATLGASHKNRESNVFRVNVTEALRSRIKRGIICLRYLLLVLANVSFSVHLPVCTDRTIYD
jgi:hypothetical protein